METQDSLKTLLGALVKAYKTSNHDAWKEAAHLFNNTERSDNQLPEVMWNGTVRRVLAISRYGVGQVQLMDAANLVSISSLEPIA